jgi:hypothetical protein
MRTEEEARGKEIRRGMECEDKKLYFVLNSFENAFVRNAVNVTVSA